MTVRLISLDLLDPCRFQRPYHADEDNIEAIRADLEANGGLLLNPIHAIPKDDGRWEILAGHDRAEAARRRGLTEVGVRSFHGVVVTDEEVWCHWKRENDLRKTPDRRRDVEETLARFTEWSDRRIASVCGVSPTTVGKVRAELEDAGTVSSVDTREGVDGIEQPARKPPVPRLASEQDAARKASTPEPEKPRSREEWAREQREAAHADHDPRFPEGDASDERTEAAPESPKAEPSQVERDMVEDREARAQRGNAYSHIAKVVYFRDSIRGERNIDHAATLLVSRADEFYTDQRYTVDDVLDAADEVIEWLPRFVEAVRSKLAEGENRAA